MFVHLLRFLYHELSLNREEIDYETYNCKEIYTDRKPFWIQEVTVGGWVRSVRGSKAFGFIVLHDGSCFDTLQVVYHDTMDNFAEISKLNVGGCHYCKELWLQHRRLNSLLRSRHQKYRWRERLRLIILFRRNATPWNT